MAEFTVRPATDEDLPGIATVRVLTWKHAYAGIVPAGYLCAMDVEAEVARRRGRSGPFANLVADGPDGIVGWASYGAARGDDVPPGAGEVGALYVLPEHQGRGIGAALLAEAASRLTAAGLDPVLLWVLRDNHPSRRFYESQGFVPTGAEKVGDGAGIPLPEVRYRRS